VLLCGAQSSFHRPEEEEIKEAKKKRNEMIIISLWTPCLGAFFSFLQPINFYASLKM
jgi:hypothetical protein